MSRERELLESVVEYWGIQAYPHDWEKLVREIRAYLASEKQDQPEPVAWLYSKGDVWAGTPAILTAATTGKDFAHQEPHYDQKPLYLHPAPRKPFVRLSEEEIQEIHSDMYDATTGQWSDMDCFARAIEDALEIKNRC